MRRGDTDFIVGLVVGIVLLLVFELFLWLLLLP